MTSPPPLPAQAEDVETLERALASDPTDIGTIQALGDALLARGAAAAARDCFDAALSLDTGNPRAWNARGVALAREGRQVAALASFSQALALDPGRRDALANRAATLLALRRLKPALDAFDRIVAASPHDVVAHLNRGVTLHLLGRDGDALAAFNTALGLSPDDPSVLFNRATVRAWTGDRDGAIADLARALDLSPNATDIRENLARALVDADRCAEALAVAAADPRGQPRLVNVAGAAHVGLGQLDAALQAFDAARAADPGLCEAHHNRGLVLDDLGRPAEALQSYAAALALKPGDPEIRFCAALSRLTLGDPGGWSDYRTRHQRPEHPLRRAHPELPEWQGEAMPGGILVLSAEQGFGDTLLFARFVAPATTRAKCRVIVEAPAPLVALLDEIPGAEADTAATGTAHCALPDLPEVLRLTAADLESLPAAYLAPPPDRVAAWAGRLGPPQGPRIGIAWRGRAERRTAPHLTRAIPLAAFLGALPADAEVFPLQVDLTPEDAATLAADPRIRDYIVDLHDFADTAALAASLDLVVSVDSGPAHLALATGRETWVLPPYSPDWRWGLGPETTPWYPTARLLRQPTPGQWPLAKLKRALLERFL
jgi:Flp pilus assembly protein TadD